MDEQILRELIIKSIEKQGFSISGKKILLPNNKSDKETLRQLHSLAVQHRIDKYKKGLIKHEDYLLTRLALGTEIVPDQISPKLIEVQPLSKEELLFRYASLHWSIPVSSGYGRRLRFLVVDEQNEKLIGLIGLADPVFSLKGRDTWIGWDRETQKKNLHCVMDAFILGAVPPYSFLLGGKLIGMLATSNEVRMAFLRKYANRQSLIQQKELDARLALITTTSALGKSSVYNRIKYKGRLLYHRMGFTRGSGDFHFTNGLYDTISKYVVENCEPTAKQKLWGTGFRNRREVIRKCLSKLGLPIGWAYHGVHREIFLVPLAKNTQNFLRGEHTDLQWFDQSAEELAAFFKDRWLIPRSQKDERYKLWNPEEWRLWG